MRGPLSRSHVWAPRGGADVDSAGGRSASSVSRAAASCENDVASTTRGEGEGDNPITGIADSAPATRDDDDVLASIEQVRHR